MIEETWLSHCFTGWVLSEIYNCRQISPLSVKQRQELFLHLCLCITDHETVPYLSGGRLSQVHHRQKEYACSMKLRVQLHLGGWRQGRKVIFIHYSQHFHTLHEKKRGILFSEYKLVSTHCLLFMSCLFCTCLQMGQGWVPEHFFSFSDADD